MLGVLVITCQALFIPEKEIESLPNLLIVLSKEIEHLDVPFNSTSDLIYSHTSLNNFQEKSENPKRYKRWGWNPVNVLKKTFENVKSDVNKAIVSVQKVGENAIDAVKTNADKAIVSVQNVGQTAVGAVKTNAEKAIVVVDKTGKDAIGVIQSTGEDAVEKVKITSKTVFFTVRRTGKSIIGDIDSLAAGSINVIHVNGVRIVAVISKNVIDPVRSQAEIIINDEETMKLIRNAALEGSCAVIGTVTGLPGAIVTGVACELIRQIQEEGFDSVANKIKNGDIKFISKLVLKGACGGVTAKVGLFGAVAAEEVCTIIEIIIDNDEVLKDREQLALKLGFGGACGGLGSIGKAPGAAIAAVGCSIANDLNDQGKIIKT